MSLITQNPAAANVPASDTVGPAAIVEGDGEGHPLGTTTADVAGSADGTDVGTGLAAASTGSATA